MDTPDKFYFIFDIYSSAEVIDRQPVYNDLVHVEVLDTDSDSAKKQAISILGKEYSNFNFMLKSVIVKTDKN